MYTKFLNIWFEWLPADGTGVPKLVGVFYNHTGAYKVHLVRMIESELLLILRTTGRYFSIEHRFFLYFILSFFSRFLQKCSMEP